MVKMEKKNFGLRLQFYFFTVLILLLVYNFYCILVKSLFKLKNNYENFISLTSDLQWIIKSAINPRKLAKNELTHKKK